MTRLRDGCLSQKKGAGQEGESQQLHRCFVWFFKGYDLHPSVQKTHQMSSRAKETRVKTIKLFLFFFNALLKPGGFSLVNLLAPTHREAPYTPPTIFCCNMTWSLQGNWVFARTGNGTKRGTQRNKRAKS